MCQFKDELELLQALLQSLGCNEITATANWTGSEGLKKTERIERDVYNKKKSPSPSFLKSHLQRRSESVQMVEVGFIVGELSCPFSAGPLIMVSQLVFDVSVYLAEFDVN